MEKYELLEFLEPFDDGMEINIQLENGLYDIKPTYVFNKEIPSAIVVLEPILPITEV